MHLAISEDCGVWPMVDTLAPLLFWVETEGRHLDRVWTVHALCLKGVQGEKKKEIGASNTIRRWQKKSLLYNIQFVGLRETFWVCKSFGLMSPGINLTLSPVFHLHGCNEIAQDPSGSNLSNPRLQVSDVVSQIRLHRLMTHYIRQTDLGLSKFRCVFTGPHTGLQKRWIVMLLAISHHRMIIKVIL